MKPAKPLPLWLSLLVNMLAALIVVSMVQAFLVKVYRVPSASMEQTLQAAEGGGDRLLVSRTSYLRTGPSRGDVVVFTRPAAWSSETAAESSAGLRTYVRAFGDLTGIGPSNEQYLVKRVIAVEGDTVSCCSKDGRLTVNGFPVNEAYIYEDLPFVHGEQDCYSGIRSLRCFAEYTVPENELFVLGDHRSQSSDSAIFCRSPITPARDCVRSVPEESVVGHAVFKVWPLDRIAPIG